MVTKTTRIGLVLAVSPLALLAASPALAQTTVAPATPQPTGPQTGQSADTTPSPSAAPKGADNTVQNSPEDAAIVVTGIRASLAASERIKRNNPVIVEAVSAEDIGKLPDVSIADSLARLPGVTAQRLEGRDQRLSIRGLGPDFGVTLLNGREQVTVGDNRGVEYDQYPSEFFRNVVVYKSANASVVPSGIAGTVDLRMLRPLNEKRAFAVSLRGQMNSHKSLNPEVKRTGYRGSATFIDQWAHDTWGIALGFSTMSQPTQNERYNAWGFPNSGSAGGNLLLGGAKPYVESSKLQRTGLVGTLEFRPNDKWHSTLDVLVSKFKETQYLRGIEFPIAPDWGSGATVANYTANNGFVTDATITGVEGVVRNDYNQRKANNFSIGFNNVVNLSEGIRLNIDESWSHTRRTDFLLENYSGTGYGTTGAKDTLHISQNPNGTFSIVPTLNYGNPSNFVITDPRGWGYNGTEAVVQAGFLNRPHFKDDLKSIRASLDGDLNGFFNKWEVGAVWSRRKKSSSYSSAFLCPKDNNPSCTVSSGTALSIPIPQQAIVGTVPLDYLGVPSMIALDPLYLYNNVYDVAYDNRPDSLARDYSVTERILTGYAQVNIDSRLGNVPVTGAIGAQLVHSDQISDGFTSSFSAGPPPKVTVASIRGGSKYTNLLPSAALSFQVVPSGYLKLGVSKTMIRPRLDQERVTSVVSFNAANIGRYDPAQYPVFSAYGGNAELKPYKSLNLDGSAEYYFRKGGYVSLSAYYKRLTDYVDPNRSFLFDFAPYAAVLDPVTRAQVQGKTVGLVSGPANDGKGHIFGQEATVSLPFSNFIPALDGFGFFGSIAHVSSKVRYASQTGSIPIPGLSKYVGTAEGYYEHAGFQARLSYRYRSKFLGEVAGLSAAPTFRTAKAEGILDAQVGYEFQPGTALQGLSVTVQAKNLTDRPFVTYENDDTRRVIDYQRYGRDYYLTLAYKF